MRGTRLRLLSQSTTKNGGARVTHHTDRDDATAAAVAGRVPRRPPRLLGVVCLAARGRGAGGGNGNSNDDGGGGGGGGGSSSSSSHRRRWGWSGEHWGMRWALPPVRLRGRRPAAGSRLGAAGSRVGDGAAAGAGRVPPLQGGGDGHDASKWAAGE